MQLPTFLHTTRPAPPGFRTVFIAAVLFFTNCPFSNATAQGDLMVIPKRIVFDGSKRTHEINLANTGKDTARYDISLIHYRMKDDGAFELMKPDDTSGRFADRYVRYFPRRVVLGPNESQTVRIQLTKVNQLLPGEYRSHMYFRAVPQAQPLGMPGTAAKDTSAVSIRLVPVFGISIPVIIKVGESNTSVSISDCWLEMANANTPILNMTLNRKGNMSVYGDISIEHISPKGKITQAGTVKGLAVYTPNSKRHIRIALTKTAGIDYSKGKLYVLYKTQSDADPRVLAETQIQISYNPNQH